MKIRTLFSLLHSNPKLFWHKTTLRIKNIYNYLHGYVYFLTNTQPSITLDTQNLHSTIFFDLSTAHNKPLAINIKNQFFSQLQQDPFKNQFSFNITPPQTSNPNPEVYGFDIKTVWEHARFSDFLISGEQFQKNPEAHLAEFERFKNEITTWQQQNPFLSGSCWMNAMEVGIRAINLLWLFHFFYHTPTEPEKKVFWQKYLDTLWAHAIFINNYWEEYDILNNHYLVNLTGAWYLALFFAEFEKFPFGKLEILWEKVCHGFENQLHPDGTLNEGSTSYHKLIMQCLLHLEQLNIKNHFKFTEKLNRQFRRGIQFLADSKNTPTTIVQIGDNDSNFLISPLNLTLLPDAHDQQKMAHELYVKEYPDFGVVFLANQHWHVSLRTKSFAPTEPRGHFHVDLLAITASYLDQPIIIDPGTGWYTANTVTRNLLRSAECHSTVFPQSKKLFEFDSLFSIAGEPVSPKPVIINKLPTTATVTAQFEHQNILCTRSIKLDGLSNVFTITDTTHNKQPSDECIFETNYLFAPELVISTIEPQFFALNSNHSALLLETSAHTATATEGWCSKEYGHLERCPKLLWLHKNTTQTITRLYPK